MSIFLVYLLALVIVPLSARIILDQRAGMAVFIGEIGLILASTIVLAVASCFIAGIWPHLETTAATPLARSFTESARIFATELGQFLWRTLALPGLAALGGAVCVVLWQLAEGLLRYRVGKRRYRRKRISLGLSTRGF